MRVRLWFHRTALSYLRNRYKQHLVNLRGWKNLVVTHTKLFSGLEAWDYFINVINKRDDIFREIETLARSRRCNDIAELARKGRYFR